MLARFIDSRRVNAGALIALGISVPFLVILSQACASLLTLRRSWVDAGVVSGAALLLITAVSSVMGQAAMIAIAWAALLLAVSISGAHVLKMTGSLSLSVGYFALISVIGLLILVTNVHDPHQMWVALWEEMLKAFEASGRYSQQELDQFRQNEIPRIFTGVVFAVLFLMNSCALFWSRYWHAQLANPGGFGEGFRTMGFGRVMAVITITLMIAGQRSDHYLLLNLLPILSMLWILQGLSAMHAWVHRGKRNVGWLVLAYAMAVWGWPITLVGLFSQISGWPLRGGNGSAPPAS